MSTAPSLASDSCPLCVQGLLRPTPTAGRWECDLCRAVLLVGRQETVTHVRASRNPFADLARKLGGTPPTPWPAVHDEPPPPMTGKER